MNLKFGTDGIRGPVETLITPEACLKIGYATGTVARELGWKTVMIGKDTRVSGYMLESALQAGFISAGIDVKLLGVRTLSPIWIRPQAILPNVQSGAVV